MSELEHARAMVARCTAKRDAATDALSRRYYELCLVGWQAQVKRLEQDNQIVLTAFTSSAPLAVLAPDPDC